MKTSTRASIFLILSGNVIVFRIESDFSFPTRSHHFLVSPRLLSDAHWHTFAFEVREIGLVAITLDDRTYKLDLITFAESTILIIGDEYQYTLYLPRSNERHRDSRYLKMSVGHICFKNLQVNHQEVSPKYVDVS